jgi:hypothetical protein
MSRDGQARLTAGAPAERGAQRWIMSSSVTPWVRALASMST